MKYCWGVALLVLVIFGLYLGREILTLPISTAKHLVVIGYILLVFYVFLCIGLFKFCQTAPPKNQLKEKRPIEEEIPPPPEEKLAA